MVGRGAKFGAVLGWALCCSLLAACGAQSDSAAAVPARGQFDAPARDVAAAPPAELALPEAAPVVLFLGDSIGAGLHLAEHQAFPALVQWRLAQEGLPFRLVNASESGRTTAGGLAAIDWSLRSEPDVVVIELGGNDGLRGLDPEVTEQNLRELIERSRAAGAAVLLLGVRLPPNYGSLAERYDELYPALAEETEVAFLPFFMEGVGGVPELNLADGLHPTAEGHERLAENVAPALRAVLESLPAR
jgi:acyl-CoA thioesterase-1